jgi:hypothetical protein
MFVVVARSSLRYKAVLLKIVLGHAGVIIRLRQKGNSSPKARPGSHI